MAEMDVKSLKGIAVVSIEHGEKVGTVDNMVFDLEARKVLAFKIRKSSMPRSGKMLLSFNDIRSIGPDAVMIENKDCLRNEKKDRDFHNRPDLSALSGLRVVTRDGTFVGNLATVQFDTKTGHLNAIETTGGGFIDILRRNQVIEISEVVSIGTDVVVVPDSYAPEDSREDETDAHDKSAGESATEKESERILQLPASSDDTRH